MSTDFSLPAKWRSMLLASLRSPIASLEEVQDLLLQVLSALGTVPLTWAPAAKATSKLSRDDVIHTLPTIHHVVLSTVLPVWLASLKDAGLAPLAEHLFCPSNTGNERTDSGDIETCSSIVVSALPALLSHLNTLTSKDPGPTALLEFNLSLIERISVVYPLDTIHKSIFTPLVENDVRLDVTEARQSLKWEDYVRSACSIPGRVANVLQGRRDVTVKEKLEHGPYFSQLCISTERLLYQTSHESRGTSLESRSHLLLKLLNLALFPLIQPPIPSQPSFFSSTLPVIRKRLHASSEVATSKYPEMWATLVRTLPSASQQTFVASLLGALECHVGVDVSVAARYKVGGAAKVLRGVLGQFRDGDCDDELWSAVVAVICSSGKSWDLGVARAVVWWIAAPRHGNTVEGVLRKLLDDIVALWTDPEYIHHSLLSLHRYMSSLLLLTLAAFSPASRVPGDLAFSSPFIASISTYIAHLDKSVRRCGMIVAEVVAARCGKKLEFGGWEGSDEIMEWARTMRTWQSDWTVGGLDTEAEASTVPEASNDRVEADVNHSSAQALQAASYDSDDSLVGYESSTSSRTPSPTPSELAEIEKDPSLRVGRNKPVARPVYLAQLATMLRTDRNNDEGEAERLEVALASAEVLIRRKKGFGFELDENAVELTIALIGLHNNYELEGFDTKRQSAVTALVACCPRRSAMTLVEQLFTNQYGIGQRVVMLTALALGARELAGLPVPPSQVPRESTMFPSKMLPAALHRRLEGQAGQGQVQRLVQGISAQAISKSKDAAEDALPPIVRERQLRVGRLGSTRITEVGQMPASAPLETKTSFAEVAAEYFIIPLINHMWQHLRDAQTRHSGRRAGMVLVLTAVVLSQYLGTLAVLMHAARHAPAYLEVLAPEALEITVSLGSRPVEMDRESQEREEGEGKEASVLVAALEVALVVLDACVDLDGGRALGLGHTALLFSVGEWAGGVFEVLERGRRIRGGGGEVESRLGSAAAGVVLKVDQVREKWRRSMVQL